MNLLQGKTAIVTGATRGIGKVLLKFLLKMALTLPLLMLLL